MRQQRPVDHLVLPVSSLDAARQRLGRLGFTLAPEAHHPFGTSNSCVFLPDGTYLEPLAVSDRALAEQVVREGNVFVARDRAYRFRQGEDGFSAVVFATPDARQDHEVYAGSGLSAGDMLDFSREAALPDGTTTEASFLLAFCGDLRAPDIFFFACQRVADLPTDRTKLQRHANAATGLREILLYARDPSAFVSLLSTASGATSHGTDALGVDISLPNVRVRILSAEGYEACFDETPRFADKGLHGVGIVFSVADLTVTDAVLAANGVTFTRKNNRNLVKAAPGQGALFAFEE